MTQILPQPVADLMHLRGQIACLTTVRPCKVLKGNDPITKESRFTCRIGVTYDNIRAVQEKRETGELPAKNAGLAWGEWAVFPYVLHHKGEWYFRCTDIPNGFKQVAYYQNGREISPNAARLQCQASEFREGAHQDVFTIKISSIVRVNREAVAA